MPTAADGLLAELSARVAAEPFNAVATGIFVLAVVHTFVAARFTELATRVQARHDQEAAAAGRPPVPSVAAKLLHFVGEVEVVFGLWAVPLLLALAAFRGMVGGNPLRQRHRPLHRSTVRRGDHGAGLDSTGRRAGGTARCSELRPWVVQAWAPGG